MDDIRKESASTAHRVVVLVRDGVMPMELGLVHQLFGAAVGEHGERLYDVRTCTPLPGDVRTDADFSVRVNAGPEALDDADTVVVPASHESDERAELDPDLAGSFGRIPAHARLASICTGAFVLAAAGRLDGRRATTHWKSANRFRELFPRVDLDPGVLFVDEGGVLTSAGEASGVDLCLHLIRVDHGAAVANEVARTTVVPPYRDGGQAQFIPRPVPERASTSTARTRAWALQHLGMPLTVEQMARQSAMSVRTFSRRFRSEVGATPMHWLVEQRLQRARELLETTALSIEQVAAQAGFGTGASLRQHFRAALDISPTTYRARFRPQQAAGRRMVH